MKKFVASIVPLCVACCLSLPAICQELSFKKQVLYRMSYQKDSSDKSSVQQEMMELLLNDSLSIFQSEKTGTRDSIEGIGRKSDPSFRMGPEQIAQLRTPVKYSVFKYPGGNVLFKENFTNMPSNSSNIKYYSEQEKPDWQLSPESATVNGFRCRKATLLYAGRTWQAWYAPEIPIKDGPYKFSGLPGLIVKISDESGSWVFDLVEIKPLNRTVEIPDGESIKRQTLSKPAFYKEKRYYIENETIIKEGSGLLAFRDQTTKDKMVANDKKKSEKDNNWIEEPALGR